MVNEEEESFYVNLEEFRKDKEKPRSSSQKLSSSSNLDDWETHTDQGSGQLFYYNSVTRETTWDCPFDQAEEQLISPASLSPAEEDCNWEKLFDESSGQFYFHNPVTGETSWDPPAQDDLHPSGGKPMFSPYNSMDGRVRVLTVKNFLKLSGSAKIWCCCYYCFHYFSNSMFRVAGGKETSELCFWNPIFCPLHVICPVRWRKGDFRSYVLDSHCLFHHVTGLVRWRKGDQGCQ